MILVDTNVLVALGNVADSHHRAARELLETATDRLLVPPTVIAEVCHLVGAATGAERSPRHSFFGRSRPGYWNWSS